MSIPYDRLVAWLAGPIAIVAGAVAVWLDNHFGLLGKAGLGHDQTAKAIVDGLTFGVGAMSDGRAEVFVETSSGEVLHRWNTSGGAWSGWQSLGTPGG